MRSVGFQLTQAGSIPVRDTKNLLSESKHGVGASLLTKNELGSIPSRTAIIETHTDPPCYLGSQRVTAYGLFKCVSIMGAVMGYGVSLQDT